MNYIITGGTGFIGTHLTNLLRELNPDANIYNLDIVKPGTPNPVVKITSLRCVTARLYSRSMWSATYADRLKTCRLPPRLTT